MTSTAPAFRKHDRVTIEVDDKPLTVTITKRLFSSDAYEANGHGKNWTIRTDEIKGLSKS